MSATYWDPQRLLDINVSGKRVTCVGQKKQKWTGPCSFKPPDAEVSGVRQVLQQLSRTPPELVTFSKLYALAQLCLCKAYHSGQCNMIATRWQQTVKTAIFHKNNMSAAATPLQIVLRSGGSVNEKPAGEATESFETLARLKRDLERKQRLLESYGDDIDHLTAKLRLATEAHHVTTSKLQGMSKVNQNELEARKQCEDEIVNLRNQLSYSQEQARSKDSTSRRELDRKSSQVNELQDDLGRARRNNEQLQAQVSDLEETHSTSHKELERTLSQVMGLQAELDRTLRDNEQLQDQVSDLKEAQSFLRQSLEKLRSEAVVAGEREEQMGKTLEGKEVALHDCQSASDQQKSRISDLEKRVSDLNLLNGRLECSITECWLHRLKTRIAALRSKHRSVESH